MYDGDLAEETPVEEAGLTPLDEAPPPAAQDVPAEQRERIRRKCKGQLGRFWWGARPHEQEAILAEVIELTLLYYETLSWEEVRDGMLEWRSAAEYLAAVR
jgi:hypothetical protein